MGEGVNGVGRGGGSDLMGDGYGNIKDVMGFVPVQIVLCESFRKTRLVLF